MKSSEPDALNVLDEDVKKGVLFSFIIDAGISQPGNLPRSRIRPVPSVEWAGRQLGAQRLKRLFRLADGDPLLPLPQTGWEETTLTAVRWQGIPRRLFET